MNNYCFVSIYRINQNTVYCKRNLNLKHGISKLHEIILHSIPEHFSKSTAHQHQSKNSKYCFIKICWIRGVCRGLPLPFPPEALQLYQSPVYFLIIPEIKRPLILLDLIPTDNVHSRVTSPVLTEGCCLPTSGGGGGQREYMRSLGTGREH